MTHSRSLAVTVVGCFCTLLVGEPPQNRRLSFATFNAELVPRLADGHDRKLEARREAQVVALRALGADAVCLQEVWRETDADALRKALRDAYPFSFRPPADPGPATGEVCPLIRSLRLRDCLQGCRRRGTSIRACARQGGRCGELVSSLAPRCRLCLAANVDNPVGCVFGGGQSFIYGGSSGLLLLSRRPLRGARFRPFGSTFIRRGMIDAEVAGRRVLCTHLSSGLGVLSYPPDGPHGGWEGEHQAQIDALTRMPRGCVVLLGDLNAGPAVGALAAERPHAMATLRRAGFTAPWARPRCTWCRDNPMATGTPDRWLDHVLVRDCPAATRRYVRVLDQRAPTLSDHYGLLMVEQRRGE